MEEKQDEEINQELADVQQAYMNVKFEDKQIQSYNRFKEYPHN